MSTNTPIFGFNLPAINSATDEDLWGDELNANWSSLETLLNALIPVGTSFVYRGGTVPSRFLLEDGSLVLRATYPALFTAIGETYGAGDGSTTFALPDSISRVDVGIDVGGVKARLTAAVSGIDGAILGDTGGDQHVSPHTLTSVVTESPHQHAMQGSSGGGGQGATVAQANAYGNPASATALTSAVNTGLTVATTDSATGTAANVQPTLVATKMIRAL